MFQTNKSREHAVYYKTQNSNYAMTEFSPNSTDLFSNEFPSFVEPYALIRLTEYGVERFGGSPRVGRGVGADSKRCHVDHSLIGVTERGGLV